MYIAVAAMGDTLESKVSERFASCKSVLIVNMPDSIIDVVVPNQALDDESLAEIVKEHDCEAIITGELSSPAFEVLANACITRFSGIGYGIGEALVLMETGKLKLIRNPEGTDVCEGAHHK